MPELAICLDALAALRDETGARDADLAAAATLAELAGVGALRLSLTEELRPVSEADVRAVRRAAGRLELCLAPMPSLLKVALEMQPERVVFASEARGEWPSAVPLDFRAWGGALAPAVRNLSQAGIAVAARISPDLESVKEAHAVDMEAVEFTTGSLVDLPGPERVAGLEKLSDAARLAAKLRLGVGVAGGLGPRTLGPVLAAVPAIERVCVGRAFAARALLVGIERAISDFLNSARLRSAAA